MKNKIRHITQEATESKSRVDVWNESETIELTMSVREVVDLNQRYFVDIGTIVSDELMGQLLHHFRDEATLLNREDLSRV